MTTLVITVLFAFMASTMGTVGGRVRTVRSELIISVLLVFTDIIMQITLDVTNLWVVVMILSRSASWAPRILLSLVRPGPTRLGPSGRLQCRVLLSALSIMAPFRVPRGLTSLLQTLPDTFFGMSLENIN